MCLRFLKGIQSYPKRLDLLKSLILLCIHQTQCYGSVLNSIRIRIQISQIQIRIRLWIRIQIQVFSWSKWKKFPFQKIKTLFSVTNWYKDIYWGISCLSKNHPTFCKMANALFTLKSLFYFPFWTPFRLSWIRIRIPIPITDSYPDPGESFQNGSIRIRIRNTDQTICIYAIFTF